MDGVSADLHAPRRSDATRNRAAIVEAARQLLGDSADFPMSEVARRAGVGQGTLYRNFPDRNHLAAAVLEDEVDQIEQLASRHVDDPDAFFVLLRAMTEAIARSNALPELARRDAAVDVALERSRKRIRALLSGPLRAAKGAGSVRRDLVLDDVFILLWMIRGANTLAYDQASRVAIASRALTLVLDGVLPSGRP
jgi:AcrR family transcriptional regulator